MPATTFSSSAFFGAHWRALLVSGLVGLMLSGLFLFSRWQNHVASWRATQQAIAQSDLAVVHSLLELLPELPASFEEADPRASGLTAIPKLIAGIQRGELTWNDVLINDYANKETDEAPSFLWSDEPNQYQRLRTTLALDESFRPHRQLVLIRRFANREIERLGFQDWLSGGLIFGTFCIAGLWFSAIRHQRKVLLSSLAKWYGGTGLSDTQDGGNAFALALEVADPEIANIVSMATESHRSKLDSIQQSVEQSSRVLSQMPVGVVAFDSRLRLLFVNRAGRELLGITTTSQVGQSLIEVVRQPTVVNLIQQVLHQSQVSEVELEIPMSKVTLRLRAHPLTDPSSENSSVNPSGVLLIVSDETRLKQLENARRDFTANVSHELKTPLSAIKAYAETLLIGALEDEDAARRFVERISEQAHRLDLLIRDLLHLTKLQSQPEKPPLVALNLDDILKTCVEEHQTIGKSRKISIDIRGVEKDCLVLADLESLRTILGNLLSNAVRYNRTEGWVRVATRRENGAVVLSISDSGIGIPPEDLDRIFERFYRVEKARSQDAGGTGLGLSIVKHLAQSMSAEIRVQSVLGDGSVFDLCLQPAPAS